MDEATRVPIEREPDIISARQRGREYATAAGISGADLTLVATAISEIARNILNYAGHGEVVIRAVTDSGRQGVEIVGRDEGPGIADLDQAMTDGFSSGQGLGLGLPGARRVMDDFEIASTPGAGTTVTMRKWAR